jgi:integrase
MTKRRLTDAIVKALPTPAQGNRITYDAALPGFGVRVTAAGARAFVLNYVSINGRERRYTIGAFPTWKTTAARDEAGRLKASIRANGTDPVGELEAARAASTVADMIDRYVADHQPRKRAGSVRDEASMIAKWLAQSTLRGMKVAEVTHSDIDRLHRKITKDGGPVRANRVVALLSKMFSLAIKWHMRADNPCRGIEKNAEQKRARYLSPDELARLTAALVAHEDQSAANVVRLLLLTGARRGEVLSAKWSELDLKAGTWTKPGATTKQRTEHRVPLSAPARQMLAGIERASEYVFPGRDGAGHKVDLKRAWPKLCRAAKLKGVRVHDLRHTYASLLASHGVSLHTVGALLGHTQPSTTARYAHLYDDPLRQATEKVAAVLDGRNAGDVVQIHRRRGSS